jgi:RNA polymerase sigma factor (sigma-70 family)
VDKPTFESIVQEEGSFIVRTLERLGARSPDLQDILQEVLRAIEQALPRFDPSLSVKPETALRAWLFSICERQTANHRRKRRRAEISRAPEELDRTENPSPNAEEQCLARERAALLFDLLERIEPDRRAIVVAYDLDGVPMSVLAARLQIPVNTAWNRLRLARADLRAAWHRVRHERCNPNHARLA